MTSLTMEQLAILESYVPCNGVACDLLEQLPILIEMAKESLKLKEILKGVNECESCKNYKSGAYACQDCGCRMSAWTSKEVL